MRRRVPVDVAPARRRRATARSSTATSCTIPARSWWCRSIDDGERACWCASAASPPGGELLEVPAGKRDVDGEAPEATANRELEEEIGYRAGRLEPLCEFYNSPGFCDEYTYLFLATELEDARARRGESRRRRR